MKISKMTTDKAADVMCKVMQPICNILADRDAIPLLERLQNIDRVHPMEGIAAAVLTVLPYFLETHKEDVFAIVGGLNDKTADEIAKQGILSTADDIIGSIDKDLIDFFTSLKQRMSEGEKE